MVKVAATLTERKLLKRGDVLSSGGASLFLFLHYYCHLPSKKALARLGDLAGLVPLFNQKLLQGVQGDGFLEKSPPGRRRHS
jgi:hypothetical protein